MLPLVVGLNADDLSTCANLMSGWRVFAPATNFMQGSAKNCLPLAAGKCILAWTVHRDPPSCPQCKAPFTFLLTFRKLDGTMSDYPVEESVCLLKRAHWFEAYLKVSF